MEYISRHLENRILETSKSFSAILLTGPRQSGKTTMLRRLAENENIGRCYVTLDDLAARTHLSPNHLSRQFKRLTGLPPLAFRNSCRIDQSKRELATTGRTIGSIAIRLGYSSTQNFTTSFRLATGQTPRAWREKCLRSVQSDY